MNKILTVDNLSIVFNQNKKQHEVVKNISFNLAKGELLGIVGETGSGKSVTALSIMRLLNDEKCTLNGAIYFGDSTDNLLRLPEKEMSGLRGKEIAMIFQEPMTSLNPVYRCGEQVAEAILTHFQVSQASAKEKTIALFEKVKLPDPERVWSAYPHELSGGQKQRVMIAMALSCSPKILIADEPTTALDVTIQKSILGLLKSLQSELGLSAIFITHDLGVVADIADRVIVMRQGEIVEQGAVKQIFTAPVHPYTKGLLACRPSVQYKLSRLLTVNDFMERDSQTDIKDSIRERIIPDTALQQRQAVLYSNEPILSVSKLNTWFPLKKKWNGEVVSWVKAVEDVSFEVYPGETLGLVGESGCGKTTLGKTLVRLAPLTAGQMTYRGQDITRLSPSAWQLFCPKIQIIFQDPYSSLNPRMSIGDAIMEPLLFHRKCRTKDEAKGRTVHLLEQVGLEADFFSRYPAEFSGGQRQRICIARALSLEPEFLICDESVSALDVSVQAQVLNLLMDLREKLSFTCIFISHDLSVVNAVSDRIMVMKAGKIVETGIAEEIFRNPKSEYTRQLMEAIPGQKDFLR